MTLTALPTMENNRIPTKESQIALHVVREAESSMKRDDRHVIFSPGLRRGRIPPPRSVADDEKIQIPASMIRLIQQEIQERDYDPRIVLRDCRGLKPGTPEFEQAYLDARIRSMDQRRKLRGNRVNEVEPVGMTTRPLKVAASLGSQPPQQSFDASLRIQRPSQLIGEFGFWLFILAALQCWNSWVIGGFLDWYLLGGRVFLCLCILFFFLLADSLLWIRLRGTTYIGFIMPLFLVVVLHFALAALMHLFVKQPYF